MAGGVIKQRIETEFGTKGAKNVIKDTESIGRAQTRLGQASASASRQFAAQANGLGGLVAAYAGIAANIFAVTAAFTALSRAAKAEQTLAGIRTLASDIGESGDIILNNLQKITKGQLSLVEAATSANLALSSSFNSEQIERLANVSLKASRALGRDLTDAFNRLTRGAAKLEPELLDELGILTRIEPAVQAYAAATGKVASSLSRFEKQQAFVNEIIAEGERKFGNINTLIPTSAEKIEKLGATIINIITKLGTFIADIVSPLADAIANNLGAAFALLGVLASTAASKGVEVLIGGFKGLENRIKGAGKRVGEFAESLSLGTRETKAAAVEALANTKAVNAGSRAYNDQIKSLRDSAAAGTISNAQIRESKNVLEQQNKSLAAKIETQKAEIKTLDKSSDAYGKANANLKNLTSQLATNRTALDAVTAASGKTAFSIGVLSEKFAIGAIRAGQFAAATARSIVGFAAGLISVGSIVALIGTGLANLVGKGDEFSAFVGKLTKSVQALLGLTADFKKAQESVLTAGSIALNNLQATNTELAEIEQFTFRDKFLGIEIELSKTKEELVREVSEVFLNVNQESSRSVTSVLSGTLAGYATNRAIQGSAIVAGRAIGTTLGATLGSAILPGIGTAVGAGLGLALSVGVGFLVEKFTRDTIDKIDEELLPKLKAQFSEAFRGISAADELNFASALVELESRVDRLTFEGELYFQTQVNILKTLFQQKDAFEAIANLQKTSGLQAAAIEETFNTVEATVTGISTTLRSRSFEDISVTILNPKAFREAFDSILVDFDSFQNTLLAGLDAAKSKVDVEFDLKPIISDASDPQEVKNIKEILNVSTKIQGLFFDLVRTTTQFAASIEKANGFLAIATVNSEKLQNALFNGLTNLQQYEQGFTAIETALQNALLQRIRADRQSATINEQLLAAKEELARLETLSGSLTGDALTQAKAAAQTTEENISKLEEQLNLLKGARSEIDGTVEALTEQLRIFEAISKNQRENLVLQEKIRQTFSAEIKAAEKFQTIIDKNGNFIRDEKDIRRANLDLVLEAFKKGESALAQQDVLNKTLKDQGFQEREIAKILRLSSDLGKEELKTITSTLVLTKDQRKLLDSIIDGTAEVALLTGDQQVAVQGANLAQNVLLGSLQKTVIEQQRLNKAAEEFNQAAEKRLQQAEKALTLAQTDRDLAVEKAKIDAASADAKRARDNEQRAIEALKTQADLEKSLFDLRKQGFDVSIKFNENRIAQLDAERQEIQNLSDLNETLLEKRFNPQIEAAQRVVEDINRYPNLFTIDAQIDAQKELINLRSEKEKALLIERREAQKAEEELTSKKLGIERDTLEIRKTAIEAEIAFLKDDARRQLDQFDAETALQKQKIQDEKDNLVREAGLAARTDEANKERARLKGEEQKFIIDELIERRTLLQEQIKANNAFIRDLATTLLPILDAINREREKQGEAPLNLDALQKLSSEKAVPDFSNAIKNLNTVKERIDSTTLAEIDRINQLAGIREQQEVKSYMDLIAQQDALIQKREDERAVLQNSLANIEGKTQAELTAIQSSIDLKDREISQLEILKDKNREQFLEALRLIDAKAAAEIEALMEQKNILRQLDDQIAGIVRSNFTDFFMDMNDELIRGELTFKSIATSFRDMVGSMLKEIQAAVFRKTIVNPVVDKVVGALPVFSGTGSVEQSVNGGKVDYMAAGGMKRDRVPALLEPGEFVVRKEAVKNIGLSELMELNTGTRKLAAGGKMLNAENAKILGFDKYDTSGYGRPLTPLERRIVNNQSQLTQKPANYDAFIPGTGLNSFTTDISGTTSALGKKGNTTFGEDISSVRKAPTIAQRKDAEAFRAEEARRSGLGPQQGPGTQTRYTPSTLKAFGLGSRGMALPGTGLLAMLGINVPRIGAKPAPSLGGADALAEAQVAKELAAIYGVDPTRMRGFQKGDIDPVTGGLFGRDGSAQTNIGNALFGARDSRGQASFTNLGAVRDAIFGTESDPGFKFRRTRLSLAEYNAASLSARAKFNPETFGVTGGQRFLTKNQAFQLNTYGGYKNQGGGYTIPDGTFSGTIRDVDLGPRGNDIDIGGRIQSSGSQLGGSSFNASRDLGFGGVGFAAGGPVLNRDRVPALLEPGEFVVRRPVAKAIGGQVLGAMNSGAAKPGDVQINMNNQGVPKTAEATAPRFDGERFVVDIITRDLKNNGQIRKSLRARSTG